MKLNKTRIKELREDLRYWQGVARIEARALAATRDKCKQIGAEMRRLQAAGKGCSDLKTPRD